MALNEKALKAELAKRAKALASTKAFVLEDFCFDKQLAFINDPARFKAAVCSRRAGKCLKEGTLVLTPYGSVPIEQIKAEDTIYGYNMDGSVSPAKVVANINQGTKKVIDIFRGNRVLVSSTEDHPWVMSYHGVDKTLKTIKEVSDHSRWGLLRTHTNLVGGTISQPSAYVLGALLGDGCSRGCGLEISSADAVVPNHIATLLGLVAKPPSHHNFTWRFNGADKSKIPYYLEWCNKRYAHEKIIDVKVVQTWDRESQLKLIAGLIDTDGSIRRHGNRLFLDLGMQAKSVVDAFAILLRDLFQVNIARTMDNRDKYVNGPVYIARVGTNIEAIRVLKELSPYIQCERKQWKPEYENLKTQNMREDYYGIKSRSEPYDANCFDLSIDNDTKLFLLTNGTVTHNTIGCAADLMDTALKHKGDVAYITLSRITAKRIIWRELLKINKDYGLNGVPDKTDLSMHMPNGNIIYVSGAKDASEAEKFRGLSFSKVYIDECQSFRAYIKDLVEDIIEPALTDYYGKLILIGTPGPVPAGYFYDAAHNAEWSNHHWTMQQNPHIKLKSGKEPLEIIAELAARRGLSVDDPSIQREYFGQWIKDLDSLVYRFDPTRNVTFALPEKLTYIFGVDIGYRDADAIAVVGYSHKTGEVYLIEEKITTKQDITALVEQLKELEAKYKPVRMVMDAGALGKKIQEEIKLRHSLPIEAADKNRKHEYIKMLNDDLRTAKFKAVPNTRFEEDTMLVQWNYDDPVKPKISDVYHTDVGDAVLYAWRECKHYFKVTDVVAPRIGTTEYMDELEQKLSDQMEAKLNGDTDWTDVTSFDDLGVDDGDFGDF